MRRIVFQVLLFFFALAETGCIKFSAAPMGLSSIKEIGNNSFASFISDNQGNIYVCGNRYMLNYSQDCVIVTKTDPELNEIWHRSLYAKGGASCRFILNIGTSLFIGIGALGSDTISLIKMDHNGQLNWKKNYPISYTTAAGEAGPGQKIMIFGSSLNTNNSPGSYELDTAGNILWNHAYYASGNGNDFYNGSFTMDGGFAFVGDVINNMAVFIPQITKTNANGDTLWSRIVQNTFTPAANTYNFFQQILETVDGHLICLLGSSADANNFQIFVVVFDKNGNNRKIIDLNESYYSSGTGITGFPVNLYQASDGGYYLGGVSKTIGIALHHNIFISKFDSDFNLLWTKNYGGNNDIINANIIPYASGGFVAAGTTSAFGKNYNEAEILLLLTDENGNILK